MSDKIETMDTMENLEYITKRTKAIVAPIKPSELVQSILDSTENDNLRWYIENQATLVWLYKGKHLIIVDRQVVGMFDNREDAYSWAKDKFFGEKFMHILCESGTRQYYLDLRK